MMNNMLESTVQVVCNVAHLRHNFHFLRERDPLLPVIKSDAYGHGMLFVAKVLEEEGALGMAVGTLCEGLALREAGIRSDILLLLGILGIEEAKLALRHNLIPVVHSFLCVEHLEEAACQLDLMNVPVVLKLDTGLGRLGFTLDTLPHVLVDVHVRGRLTFLYALSHFAAAEDAELDTYTIKQSICFARMVSMIYAYFPSVRLSFSNSSALYTSQLSLECKLLEEVGILQEIWGRPGLALYGLNPLYGTSNTSLYASLKPVMSVTAPLIAVHDVQVGERLGYSCSFTAHRFMRIAIVAIGYGNGYVRQFSNKACMLVHGVRAPVVGRVFMQTTMLDVTYIENVVPGDRAYVLGGPKDCCESVTAYELADWAQTIPYEIVCGLGKNPHRVFD